MKRAHADGSSTASSNDDANKKIKQEGEEMSEEAEAVLLDENLLYEILRHVDDGRALAKAACVSRQWRRTAHDERLWELICTRQYHRSPVQLRIIVLAFGGFRKLYSDHLSQLLKPSSSSAPRATSAWPCLPPAPAIVSARPKARWGKDEALVSNYVLFIKVRRELRRRKNYILWQVTLQEGPIRLNEFLESWLKHRILKEQS